MTMANIFRFLVVVGLLLSPWRSGSAATVEEAHNRLMLTKALDLSAKRKQPVQLPLEVD